MRIVDIRSRDVVLGRFDIVHVHFPEHYVSAQTLGGALRWVSVYAVLFVLAKLCGKRIVWSVHNVTPFQNRHPWLLGPWMRLFRGLVDAHVFLSRSSRDAFRSRYPGDAAKPCRVVPHGAYLVPPPDPARESAWRARIGAPPAAFLVGVLGSIKRYKNVGALRLLPPTLSNGRQIHAVLVGTPDAESRPDLDALVSDLGARVTYLPDRADDDGLSHLIRIMDVVLLPYRTGWNSGFAMLVLGNGGRVAASNLPMFAELAQEVGPPWVQTFRSEEEIGALLDALTDAPPNEAARTTLDRFLHANSFAVGARQLAEFYEAITHL